MMEKTQYLFNVQKRAKSRVESRASRASRGSRADSRADSRSGSRASGGFSNLSFLSSQRGGRSDRNRFFTPKATRMEMPEEPPEPKMEKSEAIKIKEFYKEYCHVVKRNFQPDNQIYLVDVLEQLHFLDDEAVNDKRMNLCSLLRKHRRDLMVYSASGEYSGESEDIVKNLFKVCCGIQNFKLKQRGHNQLDTKLLYSYVDAINFQHPNPDFIVMDQLNTIKSLVNCKAFMLTHSQIEYLHDKFKNFHNQRREFMEAEERAKAEKQRPPPTPPFVDPRFT